MRNVHTIESYKTVKDVGDLVKNNFGSVHIFSKNDSLEYGKTTKHVNVYITSNEKIKLGDWAYYATPGITNISVFAEIFKQTRDSLEVNDNLSIKKIIMTTQDSLISDGVQSIDNNFLEWFVKNPNVSSVEIGQTTHDMFLKYCVNIPFTETISRSSNANWNRINGQFNNGLNPCAHNIGFSEGAKWQKKNDYTEVFDWLSENDYISNNKEIIKKAFLEHKEKSHDNKRVIKYLTELRAEIYSHIKTGEKKYGINFKEYGDALFQMIDADIEFLTKK